MGDGFRAMGCDCFAGVTAGAGDTRRAARALAAARAEVTACEQTLSRFLPDSDLSRVNHGAGAWVQVDPRMVSATRAALAARRATGGRYDPTILAPLVAAGYDRSFELLEERPARGSGDWRPGAESRSAWAACAWPRARRSTSGASPRAGPPDVPWPRCARHGRRCRVASSTSAVTWPSGAAPPRAGRGVSPWPTHARPGTTSRPSCWRAAASRPPGATGAASGPAARCTTSSTRPPASRRREDRSRSPSSRPSPVARRRSRP